MQADKDDVPDYLRRREHAVNWRLWSVLLLISITLCAGMWVWGRPIVVDWERLKSAVRFADQPLLAPAVIAPLADAVAKKPPVAEPKAANAEPLIIRTEALREPVVASPQRQREFNEHNYQPRTDVNTIASVRAPSANRSSPSTPQRATPVRQSGYWYWQNARRQTERFRIEWMTQNGWIVFNTVCQNYRTGSLEYRDCRKSAKDYFRYRCREEQNEVFCSAENRYFPLR